MRFARRNRLAETPIYDKNRANIVGFVRTIDLLVQNKTEDNAIEPQTLTRVKGDELFGEVLLQMQTRRDSVCRVIGDNEETIGLLSIDQLRDPLLKGALGSLRR